MNIKSLSLKNIGLISDETIQFNKPLILFFGEIRQGKTTILNAVRWAFGGSFPSDIIQHGKVEASIRLDFENGYILREFYRSPDSGEIKARALVLVIDGKKVARPVDKLKTLLNPFLLDQNHLVKMTELERKKYFADLFHTATPELDDTRLKANNDAQELRSKIKGYGDIDLTVVHRTDVSVLRGKLVEIKARNAVKIAEAELGNRNIENFNRQWDEASQSVSDYREDHNQIIQRINELSDALGKAEAKKAEIEAEIQSGTAWLANNPKQSARCFAETEPTEALELAIETAAADNVRAEQYEKNLARQKAKDAEQAKVLELEQVQRDIRDEKIAKLKAISDACGIPGLVFLDGGEFEFEGTQAGMLSTSQLMKLSTLLSGLYPEGIGLDLIDRAESLGTSIFSFIERAKSENKTILATVVGERPAVVPDDVGVFVVKDGKVS